MELLATNTIAEIYDGGLTLRAQNMQDSAMQEWPDSSLKLRRKMSRCHNTCNINTGVSKTKGNIPDWSNRRPC